MTTMVTAGVFDDMFLETTDIELFCNVWSLYDLEHHDGEVIDLEDVLIGACMYLGLFDLPEGKRLASAARIPGE